MRCTGAFVERGQRGQALALGLVLAGAGSLALVLLYDLGQTILARQRLTHAADAAAYSGALVQARALNMMAYINRAQIGHQVAMAHLATLASAAGFMAAQSKQSARGNPPSTVIAMFFGAQHAMAYRQPLAAPGDASALMTAMAAHDTVVHEVLADTAATIAGQLAQTRNEAIHAVLRTNYPDVPVAAVDAPVDTQGDAIRAAISDDNTSGFLARRSHRTASRFGSVVRRAVERYGFLDARNHTARNPWPVSHRCPMRRHELRRRGTTWLDKNGVWRSADTQSYHALRSNKYIGCYFREYAMGWGIVNERVGPAGTGLPHVDRPPSDFSEIDFWRWVERETDWDIFDGSANPLANSYGLMNARNGRFVGLPTTFDIDPDRRDEVLGFRLQLMLPASRLRTTGAASAVRAAASRYGHGGFSRQDVVHVEASAQTYYSRPAPREDGLHEWANAFRPFWQARLGHSEGVLRSSGVRR
ncbi:hypothetical protein RBI13_04455 [Alcaligenaceae bacterium A4P071]|nr:hypothetical protein [Alcaligenaceae bacterium A4P071]